MDGGVGGRGIVEGAVVVIVVAGGGGGSSRGAGMRGMLRRHVPCRPAALRARAAGVWTRWRQSVEAHQTRPGCWCSVEGRDSRGCDNETTLIDESSKPASHSCCSA